MPIIFSAVRSLVSWKDKNGRKPSRALRKFSMVSYREKYCILNSVVFTESQIMCLLSIVYIPELRHVFSTSYWQRVFCTPFTSRIQSWDLYRMWENCTKENFTLGWLYAYYMMKAGIFGIFTDRLYFLKEIQTIEIITDVM